MRAEFYMYLHTTGLTVLCAYNVIQVPLQLSVPGFLSKHKPDLLVQCGDI